MDVYVQFHVYDRVAAFVMPVVMPREDDTLESWPSAHSSPRFRPRCSNSTGISLVSPRLRVRRGSLALITTQRQLTFRSI